MIPQIIVDNKGHSHIHQYLVWNEQQSLWLHYFHIIILTVLFGVSNINWLQRLINRIILYKKLCPHMFSKGNLSQSSNTRLHTNLSAKHIHVCSELLFLSTHSAIENWNIFFIMRSFGFLQYRADIITIYSYQACHRQNYFSSQNPLHMLHV